MASPATPLVHPTAVIDPAARLGAGVQVGAYAVIGAEVEIGDDCRIGPHCTIEGPTRIGRGNVVHAHAAIGGAPQDKKYRGERVELVIGDGGAITRIGDRNWILAYTHVAHDCLIGSDCVFSNNATLAGHVTVGNHVILSGFAGVHQFCRIGDHAFIGKGAFVNGDVPPFVMVAQEKYARARGINAEGLKRRGFDATRIASIKRAYRALYMGDARLDEAKAELGEIADSGSDDVRAMLDFIERGERPLLR